MKRRLLQRVLVLGARIASIRLSTKIHAVTPRYPYDGILGRIRTLHTVQPDRLQNLFEKLSAWRKSLHNDINEHKLSELIQTINFRCPKGNK